MERVTSLALIPLTIWFVIAVWTLLGASRASVLIWAAHPINTVLLLALVIAFLLVPASLELLLPVIGPFFSFLFVTALSLSSLLLYSLPVSLAPVLHCGHK